MRFEWQSGETTRVEIRLGYQPHENRGARVPVEVKAGSASKKVTVDMRKPPPLAEGFVTLGQFDLTKGDAVSVLLTTEGAGGFVHADAVQIVPVK
jgi:hypothetical protein